MSSSDSPCSRDLAEAMADAGVVSYGIAQALPVDSEAVELYRRWIAAGRHGAMDYLARYDDVRSDPRLLLDGVKSIISCAISYYWPAQFADGALRIARYALGDDYHRVVASRLCDIASYITSRWGGTTRVCVDTAPIRERYWAAKSGVGFIGRNNQLIVPGVGSMVFLGEILTTVEFDPTRPIEASCGECRRCVISCPSGALHADGTCDASRCLSYRTIEYRGEFEPGTTLRGWFYGCDSCLEACPHNGHPAETTIAQFRPRPELLSLTPDRIGSLDHESYLALTRHSAMRRAKLAQLLRNLNNL